MAAETEVFVLLVEVGRAAGDGLPDRTTGAGLLCYAAAKTEKAAVDETVAVLRTAGLAPLEVEVLGTDAEYLADNPDLAPERALMDRARDENAVIVAQVTTFDD